MTTKRPAKNGVPKARVALKAFMKDNLVDCIKGYIKVKKYKSKNWKKQI